MMEGIIEVLDEFYSSNLAQEVTRGMREAASRGYWVNSRTPYGYRRVHVQDGVKLRAKLEPDPHTARVVQRIFQQAASGLGMKEIAKALNAEAISSPTGKRWGKGRVHALLTNPLYLGTVRFRVHGRYHREARLEPVLVRNAAPAPWWASLWAPRRRRRRPAAARPPRRDPSSASALMLAFLS
ncbi:MAG: recombinase family protein [Chloroflexi bacterium]|nr:recombinase family protein [Chloroflexota bacterium]